MPSPRGPDEKNCANRLALPQDYRTFVPSYIIIRYTYECTHQLLPALQLLGRSLAHHRRATAIAPRRHHLPALSRTSRPLHPHPRGVPGAALFRSHNPLREPPADGSVHEGGVLPAVHLAPSRAPRPPRRGAYAEGGRGLPRRHRLCRPLRGGRGSAHPASPHRLPGGKPAQRLRHGHRADGAPTGGEGCRTTAGAPGHGGADALRRLLCAGAGRPRCGATPARAHQRTPLHHRPHRPPHVRREAVRLRQPRTGRSAARDGGGTHTVPARDRGLHPPHRTLQPRPHRGQLPRRGIRHHPREEPRANHSRRRALRTEPTDGLRVQRHRHRQPFHRRHHRTPCHPGQGGRTPPTPHPHTHRPGHRRLLEPRRAPSAVRTLRRAARQRRPLQRHRHPRQDGRRLLPAEGSHGHRLVPNDGLRPQHPAPRSHRPPRVD